MKRLITVLAIVFLVFAFSSNSFAQSGSVTVQWGEDSKQGADEGGYKKKGGPPPHAPGAWLPCKAPVPVLPQLQRLSRTQSRGLFLHEGGWLGSGSIPPN